MMKFLKVTFAIITLVSLLLPGPIAQAIDVTTPPAALPDSPLLITAYSFDDSDPTSTVNNRVNYIEIYNSSDQPVKVRDWNLTFTWSLQSTPPIGATTQSPTNLPLAVGNEYLAPKNYVVVSFGGEVTGAAISVDTELVGGPGNFISSISLSSPGYNAYTKTFSSAQTAPMRLKQTTTGYTSTGTYAPEDRISLYDNGWYELGVSAPANLPFGPIEILPHPRVCAPLESNIACGDYIKFYNSTNAPVSFDGTRLRIGYQGQTVSSTNAIPLSGTVLPGEYMVVTTTADESPLSITNSGGYVWLEDMYGLTTYANTITEYPDASSTSHQGESWAFINGVWDWAKPSPNEANTPLPVETTNQVTTTSSLQPCRSDQYRNPQTNRCKQLVVATSTSVACAPNQYRNPATNRCKSITTTSSPKPCSAGQIRNALTNRCKKSSESALPTADFPVTEVPDTQTSALGWVAFGGVGSMALGYGIWEWRRELSSAYQAIIKHIKL